MHRISLIWNTTQEIRLWALKAIAIIGLLPFSVLLHFKNSILCLHIVCRGSNQQLLCSLFWITDYHLFFHIESRSLDTYISCVFWCCLDYNTTHTYCKEGIGSQSWVKVHCLLLWKSYDCSPHQSDCQLTQYCLSVKHSQLGTQSHGWVYQHYYHTSVILPLALQSNGRGICCNLSWS